MSQDLIQSLQSAGVKFLRLVFCDNANIIRGKAIHLDILRNNLDFPLSITIAQQAIPVMYDGVVTPTGLSPVAEAWLTPDWQTLQILPYAPTHARVMANIVYENKPWFLCPRQILRGAIASAKELGIEIKAAFENEFTLLKNNSDSLIPNDRTVFASTFSMDQNYQIIDDITESLLGQGMTVERYYPESANGQQEISIKYDEPLRCADHQIMFREAIHAVANKHNLKASFMPKIFSEQAGNGCHLHLSLWKQGKNITGTGKRRELSTETKHFMAGVLAHLPALMAFTTPCTNSYRRLQPHCWSGAFTAWGFDNREAAIRVPTNPISNSVTHVELKTTDASANPYLALSAVIYAGVDGLRRKLALPDEVNVDPALLSDEEKTKKSVQRLPSNLKEAIDKCRQDQELITALGKDFIKVFLAIRDAEWQAMKDFDLADEVELLLQKY